MDANQKANIKAALADLVSAIDLLTDLPQRTPRTKLWFETLGMRDSPKHVIRLNQRAQERLADLISTAHRALRGAVGEPKIENLIRKHVRALCMDQGWRKPSEVQLRESDLAESLVQAATGGSGRILLLPVAGVKLENPVVELFGLKLSQPTVPALLELTRAQFGADQKLDNSLRSPSRASPEVGLLRCDVVCAVPMSGGEFGVAVEEAERCAEAVLNTACLALHYGGLTHVVLDIHRSGYGKPHTWVVVGPGGWLGSSSSEEGIWRPYSGPKIPISTATLNAKLGEDWSLALSRLLTTWATEECGLLEHQIAKMWGWLGRAHHSSRPADKLLFSIVALEAGIGLSKAEKIRQPLAQYAAKLLATDPVEQETMRKRVLRWYDQRSSLVHSGEQQAGAPSSQLAHDTVVRLAQQMTLRIPEWVDLDGFRKFLGPLTQQESNASQ